MRTAFLSELTLLARLHPEIFLIVGDLGFSVVEPFAQEFPSRFLNAGVAEQNMTGVAAGLASEGYHVFTYSIANFPVLRCLEQIRNDVCYHKLPVTVVAVGAGVSYGNLGYSHHAAQDIACCRGMPNFTVFSPADPGETRQCLRYLIDNPGPSYLRLGKAGEPMLHPDMPCQRQPLLINGHSHCNTAIIATGAVLREAMDAAASWLLQTGHIVAVYSLPWVSPLSPDDVSILWGHNNIITLEEHVRSGGIGDMLASWRMNTGTFVSLTLQQNECSTVGSQDYLRAIHAVSASQILTQLKLHTFSRS